MPNELRQTIYPTPPARLAPTPLDPPLATGVPLGLHPAAVDKAWSDHAKDQEAPAIVKHARLQLARAYRTAGSMVERRAAIFANRRNTPEANLVVFAETVQRMFGEVNDAWAGAASAIDDAIEHLRSELARPCGEPPGFEAAKEIRGALLVMSATEAALSEVISRGAVRI